MLAEMFYKFLMMIKRIRPDIQFIISGHIDFHQLLAHQQTHVLLNGIKLFFFFIRIISLLYYYYALLF